MPINGKFLDPTKTGRASEKLLEDLERSIIGQPEAVRQIVGMYQTYSAGLSAAGRPIGNFLFLGPSGTGKTLSVEVAAESLVGDKKAMLKVDCAEFQHSHEIAKLIGCFAAGTPVLMADGTAKSIEDVKVGDRVICGDGMIRPALDTHQYHHHGKMTKMHMASHSEPIIATSTHKFLAIKNPAGDGKRNRKLNEMYCPGNLKPVQIQKLFKKDAVVYPRWHGTSITPPVLDLAEWAKKLIDPVITDEFVSPRGMRATPVRRYIQVDSDFCRLAGYYVAEGGIDRDGHGSTGVSFTMGIPSKQEALDDVARLITRVFGVECNVCEQDRSERGSIRLYFHSHIACQIFEDLFGAGTHTKRVPEWFLQLPEDLLWEFIDAACMGDGGRTVPRRIDYSTTSKDLHYQFNTILRYRLGVTTQVQTHPSTKEEWATRYRTYIAGAQIEAVCRELPMFGPIITALGDDRARSNAGIQRGSFIDDQYIYFQVEGIEEIEYDGQVYDISVSENPKDQWYVIEGAVVSNSPPGYLGHRETHPILSQEALNNYHTDKIKLSFVLFDEIEKASDALWNLLLGILDKGVLTLGDNRKVDFSRAMIFMTSNLGATEMSRILSPGMGFQAGARNAVEINSLATGNAGQIVRSGLEAARKKFTPEFMNRLDRIVVFKALNDADLESILDLELKLVQQRIFNAPGVSAFVVQVGSSARAHLLSEGADIKYGARHLKRSIERSLVNPLSNLIASGQIRGGDLIEIEYDAASSGMTFCRRLENLSALGIMDAIQAGDETRGKPPQKSDAPPPFDPLRNVTPIREGRTSPGTGKGKPLAGK